MNNPKVLISAPIGGHKQYSLNYWFEWIVNQDYENFDVCLCVNGGNSKELKEKLFDVELTHKSGKKIELIILYLPNTEELSTIQRIGFSREKIRRFALRQEYDNIFWLDTDTIPSNKLGLKKLLDWGLPSVSGLYFYKDSKVPVVIDTDTHTNMKLDKLKKAYDLNMVIPCIGTGYGCVLHNKDAMKIPFNFEKFECAGEDFGHCDLLEKAGIPRYIAPSVICKHFGSDNKIRKINDMIKFDIK